MKLEVREKLTVAFPEGIPFYINLVITLFPQIMKIIDRFTVCGKKITSIENAISAYDDRLPAKELVNTLNKIIDEQ